MIVLLELAGMALLAVAAFGFDRLVGYAWTGAELLVLAYLLDGVALPRLRLPSLRWPWRRGPA